jgi:hypothetical protein
VFGDSQCEPRPAHDQAQRLISQEKVQLLIGEWCSSASVAVAQSANDEKVPLLVIISTADQIAGDAGPYAFQSSMQNRYSQQREATLLGWDSKFESVAIIVENNDFGLTFRKNMVALREKAGKNSRRHAGLQRHQLACDHHAHSGFQARSRHRVDLGSPGGEFRQAICRGRHYHAAILGLSATAAHLRASGRQAGWQDRPGARGLLREERNQHAGPEGIRREA